MTPHATRSPRLQVVPPGEVNPFPKVLTDAIDAARERAANAVHITLPLPPRALHPNSRPHWRAKAKATKQYRWDASVATFEACDGGQNWPSATVEPVFYFKDKRRRDKDGLLSSLKAAFDGLADAGLVRNDADFTYLPVRAEVDKASPRVVLVVTKGAA